MTHYIYGLHEPGGEWLMTEKGRLGWILFTHGLGHDPNQTGGIDYRKWTDQGFSVLARLNNGYGSAGTIPLPDQYGNFAKRIAGFVSTSVGCSRWIIGNEPNHSNERPDGQPITADSYARCYQLCADAIHYLPGHEFDEVLLAPIAPWNVETGDWLGYFKTALTVAQPDGFALHTYTHGSDPAFVFSDAKMSPPYQDRFYHFRAYRDWMSAIPSAMRDLPVYITETDQNVAWLDANSGWVQNAYKEIDDWNRGNVQQIRALCLYRWPKYDQWYIEGKTGVYDDFRAAMDHGYQWSEDVDPQPPVELIDYDRIRLIIREELANREPVRWPR